MVCTLGLVAADAIKPTLNSGTSQPKELNHPSQIDKSIMEVDF